MNVTWGGFCGDDVVRLGEFCGGDVMERVLLM